MNALLKSGMFLWLSLLSAQADVLFLNATSSPSDVGYYDTAGDSLITNEESYPIAMLVDEFTLSSAATVLSAQFVGGYNGTTPTQPDSFLVNFYADDNGQPGALLSSQSFSSLTRTSLAPPAEDGGINLSPGEYAYSYEGTLSLPQNLASGSYFFGLSEVGSPSPGDWSWDISTPGTAYYLDSATADYDVVPLPGVDNTAFELDGVVVPEPSTWAFLMIALVFFGLSRNSPILGFILRNEKT